MKPESIRQKKVGTVLQKEISKLLQADAQKGNLGVVITVTAVKVTVDLSIAKVHLSIFPTEKCSAILKGINQNKQKIRYDLGKIIRHQMRSVPELIFYNDDSFEKIDAINRSLAGKDPIDNQQHK